ncbi:hypothetical protein SGPA1_20581 [Streptomyces misionensis JCM 4497]
MAACGRLPVGPGTRGVRTAGRGVGRGDPRGDHPGGLTTAARPRHAAPQRPARGRARRCCPPAVRTGHRWIESSRHTRLWGQPACPGRACST